MPDSSRELATLLLQLEQQLLDPATRRDPAAIASLLAEDFREFGSSGRVYNRQQIIAELARENSRHISLSHPSCQALSDDVALLTYRSNQTIPFEPGVHANRSSLWRRSEGRWQMVFHQGTRV